MSSEQTPPANPQAPPPVPASAATQPMTSPPVPPPAPPRAPSPPSQVDRSPKMPKHDLSKRFHLTAGKTVLGTYDTREEADEEHKDFLDHKNRVLEQASQFSHLQPTKIIDKGTKFEKPEP